MKHNTKSGGPTRTVSKSQLQPATLLTLENIIQEHFSNHFKAAEALAQIRADELYKPAHKSFEEYCSKRWGYSRSYGIKLADTHGVMEDLKEYEGCPVYVTI